ncbi:unnamed protein product [Clonostachys rhizophaga]|uniref:Autophagy-related protein 1 n=1 Tax=Clonostachys rhizophaga TaxID=160324 RepID=A0A9N9YVN9_9HYPO|nr:unnamed protein product [Clonostachys rhizophaga]
MASFKTLQLIEFVLDAHPSGFYWTADLIVRAASQLVVLLTDSYQKSRIVNARDSIFDNIQQRGTNEKVGSRTDWMKKVLERPDPRRMAETASLFRTPSPGTSDRVTQRSGNGGLTRRPLKTVNVESDTKKSARYSDGDAPLNEHDLDSIDLNQDTELSSTITEAYLRRQSERAQKASGKDPLLNESPEPKKTARWPKVKELARQIQEEGSLNEHDLDKIDLNRDAKLGSRATEAYPRPQNERAQNEIEKEPLLNESPEPNKVIEQSTRSGKVVSDLVRDSKLETIIASNASVVRHISYVSNPRMRQRRLKKEETWRRRKKLGSGSFGCVWLEERLDGDDTGRLRAVKEITKSREGKRSEIDYNRELEAIAKFSHSKYVHCFVQSFGWYESENTIFITMEYIEKGDLQSYLVRPFPEEEVKQIAFQLLEGLEYMHENGFAHRDLKPANILVSEPSPNWWVKISDFGISKRAEEATAYRTFVGTRGYLAPEILGIYSIADMNNISSSQTLDDSSSLYTVSVDLWALGAIIYRLLTNEILFGDPRDLAKYVAAGHPFPRAIASELGASEACVDFLENIMARSPNSRPSSSEALRHPWLSELQDPVDTTIDALEELSIAVEDSRTKHTIVDTSVASAQWPTSLG